MKLNRDIWNRTLLLEREFIRRGEEISRLKIQDSLQITQAEAQHIIFALDNKDIIRSTPDVFQADDKKLLVFSDVHFPFQDNLAVQSMMQFAIEYQPDIIVMLGDMIDFYQISTFVKNPAKKSVKQEIDETRKFLEELRYQFPQARIIFKTGNHCDRMEKFIFQNAKQIHDLISDLLPLQLGLDTLKIEYITEPFAVGKLWFLHGHEKPGGAYNPEYITNVIWQYVHDHFIVGHFHRKQQKTFKNISGATFWTGALGYLAGQMEYALLNKWTQGFCTIDYSKNGHFRATNREIQNGEIF